MAKSLSPLRYPGGKTKIYDRVRNLIIANEYTNRIYVEPFAGGFGIGIGLLSEGVVPSAILNDFDSHIFNFWYSVLNDTENMLRMISDTPITIEERERQNRKYKDTDSGPLVDGFATLFLNRVNFSGVLKGGPIGGLSQSGTYKIDCRFNKEEIKRKVVSIAGLKKKIKLYNKDAGDFISANVKKMKNLLFINIDPPYVVKGSKLYTNFFSERDHQNLKNVIIKKLSRDYPWIITYDNCSLVKNLYEDFHMQEYSILHSAGGTVLGKEIVITNLPPDKFVW